MASHITDNVSGTGMVGGGRFYSQVVGNATPTIKSGPGRIFRLIVTAGTGAITIYDSLTASGTVIWTKSTVAAGDIYVVDCPLTTGLSVNVAASTTANFIYS